MIRASTRENLSSGGCKQHRRRPACTSAQSDQRFVISAFVSPVLQGAQWLSGRVLDSRPKGRRFEPHQRHCVVSLSKNINHPSLVLVQPRKTRPFITERLLMGRKESNQTKQTIPVL